MKTPVIDVFAGPGGLGEGFSNHDSSSFRIVLSIEKDIYAWRTLWLRSFFRQFEGVAPFEYYEYIKGKLSIDDLRERFHAEAEKADVCAWNAELGVVPNEKVDSRIRTALEPYSAYPWVLIGGPPCQAYSIAGRSRMAKYWNENPDRKNEDKRHYLYREYLRIIAEHSPPVFVMENVKGILSAEVNEHGIFEQIMEDLCDPQLAVGEINHHPRRCYHLASFVNIDNSETGTLNPPYDPQSFILRCEDFGIPQRRHRVIILGIREDVADSIAVVKKSDDDITVSDAIQDLPSLKSSISSRWKEAGPWLREISSLMEVMDGSDSNTSEELKKHIASRIDDLADAGSCTDAKYRTDMENVNSLVRKLRDPVMRSPVNHTARSHMPSDLRRYFYAACFAELYGFSPKLKDFPEELLPDHSNVIDEKDLNKFADRFRVQIANEPSSTVTSHISKDGHYFIHYDSLQCRSLTVREAARLQTFPDNYFFEGSRTQQYKQVGNAVPPLLAQKLADVVYDILKYTE